MTDRDRDVDGPKTGHIDRFSAHQHERGMAVRREVLGDAHVDRAEGAKDEFTEDFQEFITRYAWGEVWDRPGLDRRSRSVATLAALISLRADNEIAMHVRAGLRNGLSPEEIKEVILHTAIYAGLPAANAAFAIAQKVMAEEGGASSSGSGDPVDLA